MKKIILSILLITSSLPGFSQFWELGFSAGSAHYFGDLNMYNSLRTPGAMVGGIARYNFTQYIAMRMTANMGYLRSNDKQSINPFYQARNLSFYTTLYEGAFGFEFNFFKFKVPSKDKFFTPYALINVGVFQYQPKAKLDGKTYKLRDYGTEGQIRSDVTGFDKYATSQFSLPIGMGIKYWVFDRWIASFEAGYRLTTTDYLDDVSGVYVDKRVLAQGTGGNPTTPLLADRSFEVDQAVGTQGKQRGDATSNDGFMFLNFSLTYNFKSDRCPKQY